MSSSIPPYPYFNGIAYNSAFFTSIDSGLTIGQANSKYLQKTTQDTATALETFNGGIQTSTLTSSGISTFNGQSLFNNTITGIKELNIVDTLISPSHAIIINPKSTGSVISVRDTDNVLEIDTGDIAIKSTSIEQADGLPLSIGTGENIFLDVGTGLRSVAGVVHHYSDGDNAVASSGVHLNNGVSNLSNTNIHNGINSIGQLNLASGTGSSTAIVVGNTNTTTALRGTSTISIAKTNQIETTIPSEVGLLYWNTTTGSVSLCQGQSSGILNIATLGNRTGAINIGTGSTSTSPITIGGDPTTTLLKGTTTISLLYTDSIRSTTDTTAPTLFNNTTTGNIQIGQAQTTGTLSIGNGSNRNGTIGIGQTTKGNISIANNMQAGTNSIVIGTTNIGTCNLKGSTVRLNDTGTGSIEFGNSTTLQITLFKPLTPNYNATYSATTGTGTGKIGELVKPSSGFSVGLIAGVAKTLNQFTLSAGVWLCTGNVTTGSVGSVYNALSFSFATNVLDLTLGANNFPSIGGYTFNLCSTYTFSLTASTIIYLIGQVSVNDTWSNPVLTATRIA